MYENFNLIAHLGSMQLRILVYKRFCIKKACLERTKLVKV